MRVRVRSACGSVPECDVRVRVRAVRVRWAQCVWECAGVRCAQCVWDCGRVPIE